MLLDTQVHLFTVYSIDMEEGLRAGSAFIPEHGCSSSLCSKYKL